MLINELIEQLCEFSAPARVYVVGPGGVEIEVYAAVNITPDASSGELRILLLGEVAPADRPPPFEVPPVVGPLAEGRP